MRWPGISAWSRHVPPDPQAAAVRSRDLIPGLGGKPVGRAGLALLLLIVALGAHLRLQSALHTTIDKPLRADAGDYFSYALNLRTHGIYGRRLVTAGEPQADATRPPGYPLFLRLTLPARVVSEADLLPVYLAQAGLSVLTLLAVYYVAAAVAGTGCALLATLLSALSPHLILANSYVLTETLFCGLLLCGLAAAVRLVRGGGAAWALALGALLAAAALTRPWLQYFVVPCCAWILFEHGVKQRLRSAGGALLVFALVFGAWVVRNVVTLGVTGDSTLMINGLHHGMYPGLVFAGDAATFGYPYRFDPRAAEIGASLGAVLAEIARRFQEQPLAHLEWFFLGKPLTLMSWSTIQGAGEMFVYPPLASPWLTSPAYYWIYAAMRALHAPLMLLAAAGALLAWVPLRRLPAGATPARLLSLLFLYFIAVHLVVAPFPRYAIPMRPVCYILAMYASWKVLCWLTSRLAGVRAS